MSQDHTRSPLADDDLPPDTGDSDQPPGRMICGPGVLMPDPGRPGKFAVIMYGVESDTFVVLRGATLDEGSGSNDPAPVAP